MCSRWDVHLVLTINRSGKNQVVKAFLALKKLSKPFTRLDLNFRGCINTLNTSMRIGEY